MYPTLFLHVDSEALVESAGLALVPPDHVHHTPAIVFAEIVKSPDGDKTWSPSSNFCFSTHPAASLRMLRLKNPLQPSQEGTP